MEQDSNPLSERHLKINSNECSSPCVSEIFDHRKCFESPLTTSTSNTLKNIGAFSSKCLQKASSTHKICKSKLKVLKLTNKNIQISSENESLKNYIKNLEKKLKNLESKTENLAKVNEIKENTILKITKMLMKRENQFAAVLEQEKNQYEIAIKNQAHQLSLMRTNIFPARKIDKGVQFVSNPFEEEFSQKDQEIIRIQNLMNEKEKMFLNDKKYFEEKIGLLEEEIEEMGILIRESDKNQTFFSHFEEISKICSEVSLVKDKSLAILENKTEDLEFIAGYLRRDISLTPENLHKHLIQAISDLQELEENLNFL